jgi:hypothetical protein
MTEETMNAYLYAVGELEVRMCEAYFTEVVTL